MNYATWKLNFDNFEYGTGPEDAIAELGVGAEGAWVQGEVQEGGIILGYITDVVDETKLTTWEVKNITQKQALDFCIAINSEAFLTDDGRITVPYEPKD